MKTTDLKYLKYEDELKYKVNLKYEYDLKFEEYFKNGLIKLHWFHQVDQTL